MIIEAFNLEGFDFEGHPDKKVLEELRRKQEREYYPFKELAAEVDRWLAELVKRRGR